jgi:acetoin utilization deacetylase AcuC-like enzyme
VDGGVLHPDTLVSAYTYQAASLAAGSAAQLAQMVVRDKLGCG